jgi:hypothetical protein
LRVTLDGFVRSQAYRLANDALRDLNDRRHQVVGKGWQAIDG